MNALLLSLRKFACGETCPVNEQCIPGFVAGANTAWGWARTHVKKIVDSFKPSIPDSAVCFFMDGDKWCCVNGDFVNLQDSPAGFGSTFDEAFANFQKSRRDEWIGRLDTVIENVAKHNK